MQAEEILCSLEGYGKNPGMHAARLRQLIPANENTFFEIIGKTKELSVEDRGQRYALILLQKLGAIVPFIADPKRSSFEIALRLTRSMVAMDVDFNNHLLRMIEQNDHAVADPDHKLRVLDLLASAGGTITNWRQITRMAASDDQRIKSRCLSLITRHRQDAQMIDTLYERSDARSRADIVESLAAACHPETEHVIRKALADGNNRVAGNAYLAAYRAGNHQALVWLIKMCGAEQPPLMRRSAAWAMGQTRDVRFGETLRLAGKATDSDLRSAALRALTQLERPQNWSADDGVRLISTFEMPCAVPSSTDAQRTLFVIAETPDGQRSPIGRVMDYLLYQDNSPILEYSVEPPLEGAAELWMACSASAFRALSEILLEESRNAQSKVVIQSIAIYGTSESDKCEMANITKGLPCVWFDSLRHAVGSLVGNTNNIERHVFVAADPSLPADLDFSAVEQECQEASISLFAVEFDTGNRICKTGLRSFFPGEIEPLWRRYVRGLCDGFQVRFHGKLAQTNLRWRQSAGSETRVSNKLEWQ